MGKENTLLPHFGFKSFLFFITNTSVAYGQSLYLWTKAGKAGNPIKTNQHLVNIKLNFLETYFQTNPILKPPTHSFGKFKHFVYFIEDATFFTLFFSVLLSMIL